MQAQHTSIPHLKPLPHGEASPVYGVYPFSTPLSDVATKKSVAVPFNKPAFVGGETRQIMQAVLSNTHISGNGPFTRRCETYLSALYEAPTLLTSSCTHALEMAAHLLDLQPGDGVIVPSYTFVSTANAFVLRGCEIQFADCDEYGQLSLESVQRQLRPNTKAVCVVHYAGHSTNMAALSAFCKQNDLYLIEDAAQAIGARYQGQLLGTWGDLGCLSFHETKNITSGEGGALIINRPEWVERAQFVREKGTNRIQMTQGLVDKYTWVDIGSSYLMSDLNAAYLWEQLQHLNVILKKRAQDWYHYKARLNPVLKQLSARILEIPAHNQSNHHIFALLLDRAEQRDPFIAFMKDRRITTPFHFVALHHSKMGQQHGITGTERLDMTDRFSRQLVRLPLFYNITRDEQEAVIEAVHAFARQPAQ